MMRLTFSVLLIALAACAPDVPEDDPAIVTEVVVENGLEERIPEMEQCDAEDYRPLIGTPVAAAPFPIGNLLRVHGENDIIRQEYLPQRTNIVYDAEGLITRVACG